MVENFEEIEGRTRKYLELAKRIDWKINYYFHGPGMSVIDDDVRGWVREALLLKGRDRVLLHAKEGIDRLPKEYPALSELNEIYLEIKSEVLQI